MTFLKSSRRRIYDFQSIPFKLDLELGRDLTTTLDQRNVRNVRQCEEILNINTEK